MRAFAQSSRSFIGLFLARAQSLGLAGRLEVSGTFSTPQEPAMNYVVFLGCLALALVATLYSLGFA
jgi:hypothetical protein